jgi:hypothetical protein
MKGLKIEDVDYIHVEEVTFSVVMQDGSDVIVSERGIELDTFTKEQLADNVMYHIEKGKPVEILDDDDDMITFEPDIDLTGTH